MLLKVDAEGRKVILGWELGELTRQRLSLENDFLREERGREVLPRR